MKTILDKQLLNDVKNKNIDPLVIRQFVEMELIEAIMAGNRYNQSKAAVAYGVSRGTFRRLLKEYFGEIYAGTRA